MCASAHAIRISIVSVRTPCESCPPAGFAGHLNLTEGLDRVTRIDGVTVFAYRCIVCATYWNRSYEGDGTFRWSSVANAL